MKEGQLFNTRPGKNGMSWRGFQTEGAGAFSVEQAHSSPRALCPFRSVHIYGYGSRLGMHSQKLGVSGERKITHFRSRKSAALFGSPVRAGEEGNGGCQYERLLKTHVNSPAMGAQAEAQLAEGGVPLALALGSLFSASSLGRLASDSHVAGGREG